MNVVSVGVRWRHLMWFVSPSLFLQPVPTTRQDVSPFSWLDLWILSFLVVHSTHESHKSHLFILLYGWGELLKTLNAYSYGSPKVSRFSWRRKTILVAARPETWQFWSRRELHFSLLDERLSILVATCCYEAPQDLLISGRQTQQIGNRLEARAPHTLLVLLLPHEWGAQSGGRE